MNKNLWTAPAFALTVTFSGPANAEGFIEDSSLAASITQHLQVFCPNEPEDVDNPDLRRTCVQHLAVYSQTLAENLSQYIVENADKIDPADAHESQGILTMGCILPFFNFNQSTYSGNNQNGVIDLADEMRNRIGIDMMRNCVVAMQRAAFNVNIDYSPNAINSLLIRGVILDNWRPI